MGSRCRDDDYCMGLNVTASKLLAIAGLFMDHDQDSVEFTAEEACGFGHILMDVADDIKYYANAWFQEEKAEASVEKIKMKIEEVEQDD